MNTKNIFSILNLLFLSFILTDLAQADMNRTHYNGNSCKAYYPSQENQLVYFTWGVYNYGAPLYVTCPIDKHSVSQGPGPFGAIPVEPSTVVVNVNVGTNQEMTCYLDVNDGSSGLIERKSLTDDDNGWMFGFYDRFTSGMGSRLVESFGNYALWCYLPTGSYIANISVLER